MATAEFNNTAIDDLAKASRKCAERQGLDPAKSREFVESIVRTALTYILTTGERAPKTEVQRG